MPFLPLNSKPFRNVDSEANPQAIEYFVDMVKDDVMGNKTRPCLGGETSNYFCDLGSNAPIDGLFYIRTANIGAAVSGGKLYKFTQAGTVTEITGGTISSGNPATMALGAGGTGVYFCNNSAILQWAFATNTCAVLADAQAPTDATHLAVLDTYLIALRANSQQFEWSEAYSPTSWLGEYAQAESRPDYAVSLQSHFGELFIPGQSTTERWTTSGNTAVPFQRIQGSSTERGCSAPFSVVQIDNTYFYMDNERRIVRVVGSSPQVISNPYDKDFQNLLVVSDAIGLSVNANGLTLYVIDFPTDQKTYFYDYKLDYWGQWSWWNQTSGERDHWLGRTGVYMDAWNKYLVGSRVDGKIYVLDSSYTTDEGNPVISEMWTGRIDWGTNNRKSCNKLKLRVKRGVGSGTLFVYHRDNGGTSWGNPRTVDLGILGDTETVKTFRNLGIYTDRQWRFVCTGSCTLVSAEEELTVLK